MFSAKILPSSVKTSETSNKSHEMRYGQINIEFTNGAMDVRMNIQLNMLMCRERYESSTTTSLWSTRAIDTRPVD